MRKRFHALAGAAGALACSLAAAAYGVAAPPRYAADAIVSVEADSKIPAAYDESALRALALSNAVLRKAALAPEAAGAIAHAARPHAFSAFLDLISAPSNTTDSLSRAVNLLAGRIEVVPDAARSARIVVRMEEADAAAAAANAVAQAVVSAHNETNAKIDRRFQRVRRQKLRDAETRRDVAREKLAALRELDMTPTGVIASKAASRPDPAAQALGQAQRAAADAQTRRAEAERIYGPRHPEMIRLQSAAKRAAAALHAAQAQSARSQAAHSATAPKQRAEGGPDPRIAEQAAAQTEFDRAETAFERASARLVAPARQARLETPAHPPAARDGPPTTLLIAASAFLGFVMFGATPALAAARGSATDRARPARPLAIVRRGALDPAGRRRVLAAIDIAASPGARRIALHGESPQAIEAGACAIALASLADGWRPLLIAPELAHGPVRARIEIDGDLFVACAQATPSGELLVARPATARRNAAAHSASARRNAAAHAIPTRRSAAAHAINVDIGFDLVLLGDKTPPAEADALVWVGAAPPDRQTVERLSGAGPRNCSGKARPYWLALA
ncbi:MAG: hypothetical protein ACK5JM_14565 [Rhodoblastus sp.]